MTTFASCGHELENGDDGVFLATAEFDRMNNRCISYGSYCPECAKEYEAEGYVLHTELEEQTWLSGGGIKPVAYWNPDESTLAFKPGRGGNWVPLYTRG